jgi:hypothetical protein
VLGKNLAQSLDTSPIAAPLVCQQTRVLKSGADFGSVPEQTLCHGRLEIQRYSYAIVRTDLVKFQTMACDWASAKSWKIF